MKKITLLLSLLLFNLCACEVSYGHNENSGRGALLEKYQNLASYYYMDRHEYEFYVNPKMDNGKITADKTFVVDVSKIYTANNYYIKENDIYSELFHYQYDTFVVLYK